ncbi:MAG: 30S ribosomal protein S17 [Alphaproteobacteria bacterium]
MSERAPRKAQTGRVVSDRMDKTVVVAIERRTRHRLYHKSIKHVSRFTVHDEANEYRLGDLVRIVETRPLSRTKRWRVAELLGRADLPDVAAAIAADVPEPEIEPAVDEAAAEEPVAEAAGEEAAAEEPVAEAEPATEEVAAEEPVAEPEPAVEEAAAQEPVAEAEPEAAAEEPEEAPKPAPRRRTRAAPDAKAEADAPAAEADPPAEASGEPEEAAGDDAEKEAKS